MKKNCTRDRKYGKQIFSAFHKNSKLKNKREKLKSEMKSVEHMCRKKRKRSDMYNQKCTKMYMYNQKCVQKFIVHTRELKYKHFSYTLKAESTLHMCVKFYFSRVCRTHKNFQLFITLLLKIIFLKKNFFRLVHSILQIFFYHL